jgi:hypothetical protein
MRLRFVFVAMLGATLTACGGSSGGGTPAAPPAYHNVTLSWTANRETGVNSAGGGYTVNISGQSAPIDVPYVSGTWAPTSVTTSLYTGSHTATVTAYAALDTAGGTTGNTSAATTLNFVVP